MRTLRNLTVIGLIGVLSAGPLLAGQENMRDAISHLRRARAALMRAEHNKGGHRERAIERIDAAIRDCEAGIEWAKTH